MYYCIAEIQINLGHTTSYDAKTISALCQKIRQRLKICCTSESSPEAATCILVCFFAKTSAQTKHILDRLSGLVEDEGIGRITGENALVEHIDNLRSES